VTEAAATATVRAGRYRVTIARPDKVLFPDDGITKRDLAEFHAAVAETALPYLRGRPVAMERFPDGIGRTRFFQKDVSGPLPRWVETARVRKAGGSLTQILCENAATTVYLTDRAAITWHVWLSRVDRPDRPDQLIFDLDPPEGGFGQARRTALLLRELLDELELPSLPKTTGGKGIHVLVPLDRRRDFDAVRAFGRDVARVLESRDADHLTTAASKARRGGRLFLDSGRNAYAQHAVAPYSVRARPGAPVATPLDWSEVEDARLRPDRFGMRAVLRRLERDGHPWPRLRGRSLTTGIRLLERMRSDEAA
jgi:bifunctional non-homologous end joining protein LigD